MPILVGGDSSYTATNGGFMPFAPKRNDVVQTEPYIRLYEIEVPTDPQTRYRLAAYPEAVTFGTDSSGTPLVYSPYPISHSESREDLEATLPTVELTVSNITLELKAILSTHGGLIGQPVVYYLVNAADLPSNQAIRREDFEVLSVTSSETQAVFSIGQFSLSRLRFPTNRLGPQCTSRYKGPRCGYSGGLTSCSKDLEGDNGCKAHSNEVRFGGQTSIPRQAGVFG